MRRRRKGKRTETGRAPFAIIEESEKENEREN